MKYKFNSTLFLFITMAMIGIFSSCSEDENLPNNGNPMISYIRVTRPEASDSLITKAGQGQMIAVIGENLQDARELWVNDQPASLTPTLITNTTIITSVPTEIPTEITNKIKIIFANGDSLLHDFTVDISEPVISYMLSEYVNAGEVATISGNYFYEPLTVTFTGGVTGEVVSVEDNLLQVTVPEGAQPGPITISTNFGESESEFMFRDNRNIIADFDGTDFSGWWQGKDFIVGSDPDITPINNKFIRFNKKLAAYSWGEFWVGDGGTIRQATSNIPAEAFATPQNYSLKFELSTLAALTGAEVRMYMGNSADFGGSRAAAGKYYTWKPNIGNTEGEWQTVIIPFENFLAANTTLQYNPNGYQVSFYFSSPVATTPNFGMDNIRVVPNTVE